MLHAIICLKVSRLPTKAAILEAANLLLQRFDKDLRELEKWLDYGSDQSVYTGPTGVVVLYWLISNVNVDDIIGDTLDGKRFEDMKLKKQQVSLD